MRNKQKPKRNKPYRPKPVARTGIAGLAIANEANPSVTDYNKRQSGRYFAAMLATEGVWTPHQMNELIAGLNLMERAMIEYPEYRTEERIEAVLDLEHILQTIRNRRERTAKYGVTGDERRRMQEIAAVMDKFLAGIPLARTTYCEAIIHRWLKKNPAYRYKNKELNRNVFKEDGSLTYSADLTLECMKPGTT